MEILKKKSIAVLTMSLIIFVALVVTAKATIGKAMIILLILLAVFTVIDLIVDAKFLTEKQARFASTVVGLIAVVGIVIWGTFANPGAPVNRGEIAGQGNIPPPAAADETYELGLFYFERGDYEDAIQTLKEVADSSSSYVEAQKLLVEATDCYRNGLMDTANTYVEKDDYKLAIDILNAGLLVIPDDAKLLQTIDDYSSEHMNAVRTAAIADAEAYVAEQDYTNAIRAIWGAQNEVGNDVELDALQEKYLEEYKNFALVQADKLFNSEGYESAIQFLREVQSLPLLDSELSAAVFEYESYKPVALDTLEIWQHGDSTCGPYSHETVTDNYGNSYNTFYAGTSRSGWPGIHFNDYNVYKIDKMYSKLSGIFCTKKEGNSSTSESYLYIYGDDILLEKLTITGGDEPVDFTVDISGVSLLKIKPDSAIGYGGEEISFVANMYVAK